VSPPSWYRLDNAARVFAALAGRRTTTVFRLAVTLTEPVDRATLQAALAAIWPRFPGFAVRLRAGLFWHSLVATPGVPAVQEERRAPCRRLDPRTDGPWSLRILVFDRRISLEISHVLADGGGARVFLSALVAEYLARSGVPGVAAAAAEAGIPRPGETPDPEECEDAYRRFYDADVPRPPPGPRALRLAGDRLPREAMTVTLGIVPVAPLRALSREHGVSLTELLVSVLLAAALEAAEANEAAGGGRPRRPIVVMTPVDLRRMFPSRTHRNFFLSVRAEIDPRLGPWTLEDILHDVHHAVQGQVTVRSIRRQIRRHVGAERNAFIRFIPLPIKIPAKRWLYRHRWGARYTTALSNLGRFELPAAIDAHVERVEVIPNPSRAHGIGCAVIGHRDQLYVTLSGILAGTGLERAFFTRLRRLGVPVRIETA
jgi:hypothetical protein